MINFDALTLKAFVQENIEYLQNASVRKIQQPSRREVILHLRNNGENKKFYININPEFFHICFIQDIQKRGIIIPDAAPMFCMLLRKYILNGKISKVIQPFGERILELYFEYSDALGEKLSLCLAIELMGKYSNIILYNKNDSIIIGCAHNVGEEKSKYRELAGTLPYIYPEKQNKRDILQEDENIFAEKMTGIFDETSFSYAVSSEYHYLTIPTVKQTLQALNIKDINKDNLKQIYKRLSETVSLEKIVPSIKNDYSEYSLINNTNYTPQNSVNEMIDNYFEYNQLQKILKQKKAKLYMHIDTQIKKQKKQAEILKEKLLDTEKADLYKLKGDLLMMNAYNQKEPCDKIILTSPYDNRDVEIELDRKYTIIQNANRYYKLYKKTKTAIEYASSQIEEIEEKIALLEEQKFYTDIASTINEIEEISTEIGIKSTVEEKKNKKSQINLESYDIEGYKVYLGKNSIQNDYLLSKVASPEDIWFHPLNMHGAHVILKKQNENIPDSVMLACAKLTKRFAKNTNNDAKIPVIYTERKYVKKAKSKIAFVTYKNEKEIYC